MYFVMYSTFLHTLIQRGHHKVYGYNTHWFVLKLGEEEVNVLSNVQLIFTAVPHQVRVQNIVRLHKDVGQVSENDQKSHILSRHSKGCLLYTSDAADER